MKPNPSAALLASGALVLAFGSQAGAQTVLFSDNFDRVDNRNIQASLDGITDNTGSSLAADSVYMQPWLDPNNQPPTYGVQDGDAGNGGGAQILSSGLQLAVGPGTANAVVNHNFINSSILAAGGFSVSLDVTGFNGTGRGQGGAFAVGMSAADAASAGDAFGNNYPSLTRAFHDAGSSIGNDISTVGTQPVVSDFWVAIHGNGTGNDLGELVWGSSSGVIGGVGGLASKTATISANFTFSDFNAGSPVDVEIFYNGVSQGTDSFLWSGTDENYIGIDGRDGSYVGYDNFIVGVIPEPSVTLLGLIGAAGLFIFRRKA